MDAAILDDEAALRAGDPSGILDAFLAMPQQLGAVAVGPEISRHLPDPTQVDHVLICAMGGSAAAGDVLAAIARRVPATVVRGERLPAHAGPRSLAVCVSYSGGTEETLAAYRDAAERGCVRIAVCSGGELARVAEGDGVPIVRLPGGLMPRAALGALTGALQALLAWLPQGPDGVEDEALADLAGSLGPSAPLEKNEAKALAVWVGDRMPVIWGAGDLGWAAAWRWKCAFNENAKIPALASALPELVHHEVVGWSKGWGERFALIVLRHDEEPPSTERRLTATLEVVGESGLDHREVRAHGTSPLAQALSLMLVGDLSSAYHGIANGIDPAPIEAIARIKARLR